MLWAIELNSIINENWSGLTIELNWLKCFEPLNWIQISINWIETWVFDANVDPIQWSSNWNIGVVLSKFLLWQKSWISFLNAPYRSTQLRRRDTLHGASCETRRGNTQPRVAKPWLQIIPLWQGASNACFDRETQLYLLCYCPQNQLKVGRYRN